MRCNAARVYIQETLDGPLSPPDEAMLEAHMAGCEPCRDYKHTLCRIATGLGRMQTCVAPRDFASSITFQLAREKRRRQWAPLAAAAVLVAGFVTLRPLLDGGTIQVASQEGVQPVLAGQPATTTRSNLSLPGGSILDAMPAQPGRLFNRPLVAGGLPDGYAAGGPASLQGARTEPEAAGLQRIAAAAPAAPGARGGFRPAFQPGFDSEVGSGIQTGSQVDERAVSALSPALEPGDMPLGAAKSLAGPADAAPDAMTRMAKKEDGYGRRIASLPAESKVAEAAAPASEADSAAPPALSAPSTYRTEAARRARAAATRRAPTAEEQMAVDMATFEMLRWMDPAADGGPLLEVQEVDFKLP